MCPTFIATGEEIMSTRGRANAIRAALELRGVASGDPLRCAELDAALSNCLSCKACTTECPSNVNLALLKAELLHARHHAATVVLARAAVQSVDFLGRLGCRMPRLANAVAGLAVRRACWSQDAGPRLAATAAALRPAALRPLVRAHGRVRRPATRGRVVLWDDTFVRYHEPHIGIAAVKVLEAAGFEVASADGAQVLRPAGLQPGEPGRGAAAGAAQPRPCCTPAWSARRSCSWNRPAIPCSWRTTAS